MRRFLVLIFCLSFSISLFAGTGFPKELDDFIRDNSNTLLESIGKQDEQISILSQKLKTVEERSREANYDYENFNLYQIAHRKLELWQEIKEKEYLIIKDLFIASDTNPPASKMAKLENLIARNPIEKLVKCRRFIEILENFRNGIFEAEAPAFPPKQDPRVVEEIAGMIKIPSRDFHIGKYEVTQKEFQAVMGKNPSKFKGENLPVENVSWNDAMEYCKKLTEVEYEAGRLPRGYEYSLPTCEQWQFACRAGAKTVFYSGDLEDDLSKVAWWTGNSDGKTHPVGEKLPNAFGLFDMHGNVAEWCLPEPTIEIIKNGLYFNYNVRGIKKAKEALEYLLSSNFDQQRAEVKKNSKYRILHGGAWNEISAACDPQVPKFVLLKEAGDSTGFRVVLVSAKDPYPHFKTVKIPWQDFYIGKFEVTQWEYKKIMGSNPSHFVGDDLPVENVSWREAMEFCQKLTEIERRAGRLPENQKYTLPTSEQWEIACRAGTGTRYCSGDYETDLQKVAWYSSNADETHPVGTKKPNAWGIYDMHGNVWEWCLDKSSGWFCATKCVNRGGGWNSPEYNCTSETSDEDDEDKRAINLGFRIAIVPED